MPGKCRPTRSYFRRAGPRGRRTWGRGDLARVDSALNLTPAPRRLLVQWVPHAFGMRSLNVGFCRWLRRRGRSGDCLEVMVHEPSLAFGEGSWRQDLAAIVHRAMVMLLLNAARRVWVAIPSWTDRLQAWTLGRDIPFCWLPVPSTVQVADAPARVAQIRATALKDGDGFIVGHFGTYARETRRDLQVLVPRILAIGSQVRIQLLGRGSHEALADLRTLPELDASRIFAAGTLDDVELSCHLQACDLMMQPYRDGASTRRTTLMAALAHGLPVVTTVGHLTEPFWSECGAVATVAAGDLSGMAVLAGEIMGDSAQRQKLAREARGIYDSRFSIRHVISALRADACGASEMALVAATSTVERPTHHERPPRRPPGACASPSSSTTTIACSVTAAMSSSWQSDSPPTTTFTYSRIGSSACRRRLSGTAFRQ